MNYHHLAAHARHECREANGIEMQPTWKRGIRAGLLILIAFYIGWRFL